MLTNSTVGTRHDASEEGKSSRTISTYAGTMPLKPSPNAAETEKSPASSWVNKKAAIASAWQAERRINVTSPPTRSASQPQNWRLIKAEACNTDSIAAPCAAGMPTSLQNATRWLCGKAIGTQQQNPAI